MSSRSLKLITDRHEASRGLYVTTESLVRYRIGAQQVLNFTSIDLVRLAAGYPKFPVGNGDGMYETSLLLSTAIA